MKPIIQIKGIGKKYKIGRYQGKYIALRDVITDMAKSPLKFFKSKAKKAVGVNVNDEFWALQDVTFDIMPGEVVGIIGRNGAGKSTLLKILTGITPPSKGEITMQGRVASLLEVGTGFHPELTGRENIFLNGAILGMTRREIAKNFDSIVSFAEIEKFLDTPVKYYSSGMYVRLAFSVAAHMEPDILLVDEVLAVGDAEFQKKCLGKMEEVTRKQGRTILFVSHNMAAIQSLCKKVVLMEKGKVKAIGPTDEIINQYLYNSDDKPTEKSWAKEDRPGDDVAKLISARLINEKSEPLQFAYSDRKIGVEMHYEILKSGYRPLPNIHVFSNKGEYVFISHAEISDAPENVGEHRAVAWIPENLLNDSSYIIGVALSTMIPLRIHFYEREAIIFQVVENMDTAKKNDFNARIPGVVRPRLTWNFK